MKGTNKIQQMMVLAVLAWATSAVGAQTNTPSSARACCHPEMKSIAVPSERSIYQLDSEWTSDTGRTMKLNELRGKPQVMAMVYTSCMGACPLLVHQMQELAKTLPAGAATNVGFVLVTFDPQRDTPAVLHSYRVARQLDEKQWTLLHGRPEDVRELALVLGVKYREDAHGQYAHSNIITLLNADGEIAFQQNGFSSDELSRQLNHLLKP